MYTGKTEKPCCLCEIGDIDHRIDLPPRAIQQLKHGEAIAWQDVIGEVSLYFCDRDWETVCELVLETGMTPLPRCNAARASFDLREDFEAFTNRTKDVPDHQPIEERFWTDSQQILAGNTEYPPSDRELVQARVVTWALEDLEAPIAREEPGTAQQE